MRQLTENTDDMISPERAWKLLFGNCELFLCHCGLHPEDSKNANCFNYANGLHPLGQGVGCGSVGLSILGCLGLTSAIALWFSNCLFV